MYLLLAALLLLPALLAGERKLGKWVALLWLARVPVVGLTALVALASLGGSDQASPTIPNLLLMTGPGQMLLLALMAGVLSIVAGFNMVLIWERGAARTGSKPPDLPRMIRRLPAGSVRRARLFVVSAVPLLVRSVLRSVLVEHRFWLWLVVAALLGLVVSVVVAEAIEKLRAYLNRRAAKQGGRQLSPFESAFYGAIGTEGYVEGGQVLPGHYLAALAFAVGAGAYFVSEVALAPTVTQHGTALVPTLVYALGLITVLVSGLSGATFLFDRWRAPLILVWILVLVVCGVLFGTVLHEFPWCWSAKPLPTVGAAARARLDRQPAGSDVLTVVTASGGGIQAAAWTARVLTGLDEQLDGRFTRSIAVLSTVSGGSVGAYFALSAFDRGGELSPGLRSAVVRASEASSLEETAWGLLYPDLQRAFIPFAWGLKDRAWAMERGWLSARVRDLDVKPDEVCSIKKEMLSTWVEGTAQGRLPAVIFNATRIDDGTPLRITTVRLQGNAPSGLSSPWTYGYPNPKICGPGSEPCYLDLATVTAARLSATFPYVSPIARPEDHGDGLKRWNAGDGGYFDNNGTTGALAWISDLQRECGGCLDRVRTVLWVEIDPFPEDDQFAKPDKSGWALSTFGPIRGLVRVRVGSQRYRRQTEMNLLCKTPLGHRLVRVVVAPPPPEDGSGQSVREAPLSWYLSTPDQNRIEKDWKAVAKMDAVRRIGEVLGPRASRSDERVPLACGAEEGKGRPASAPSARPR